MGEIGVKIDISPVKTLDFIVRQMAIYPLENIPYMMGKANGFQFGT